METDGKAPRCGTFRKLIDTLVKERNTKGTIHIIRHGFKFYGKTFKLAFFKPAQARL